MTKTSKQLYLYMEITNTSLSALNGKHNGVMCVIAGLLILIVSERPMTSQEQADAHFDVSKLKIPDFEDTFSLELRN